MEFYCEVGNIYYSNNSFIGIVNIDECEDNIIEVKSSLSLHSFEIKESILFQELQKHKAKFIGNSIIDTWIDYNKSKYSDCVSVCKYLNIKNKELYNAK